MCQGIQQLLRQCGRAAAPVVLMLAGAFVHGQGQGQVAAPSPAASEPAVEAPAPVPLPRASEPASAPVQPVMPAPPVTPVMPGQGIAGPACPVCPPALPAADVQRLLDAATTLQTTAKEMKKDDSVFGNIFVNVLSNRITAGSSGKASRAAGRSRWSPPCARWSSPSSSCGWPCDCQARIRSLRPGAVASRR